MNPEQTQRQCKVCRESEPSFIHTVFKDHSFRQLCTNCLLKENRELFCPVCSEVFFKPPGEHKRCFTCSAIVHFTCCLPPPPSSSSTFICDPCKDPDFFFFPKSFVPSSEENGNDSLKAEWAKALVVAAKIAEASMKGAAEALRKEATKKIRDSTAAKMRARQALIILSEIFAAEKAANKDGR